MHNDNSTEKRADFYRRIRQQHLTPLWEALHSLVPAQPAGGCQAALWRYRELRPFLLEAGDLISAEEAVRRVLVLDPGRIGECLQRLWQAPGAPGLAGPPVGSQPRRRATGGDPLPRRHHRFPGAAGRRTRATLRRRCPGPGRGRAVPRHRGDLPLPRRWLATQRLNRLSPGRWKSATPAPRLQLLVAGLFYAQRGGSVEPHVVSRRWRRGSAAIAAGYSRRSGCAEWIYRV